MDSYTGVKIVRIEKEVIDEIYKNGRIDIEFFDGRLKLKEQQNAYVVVTNSIVDDEGNELVPSTSSVITRVIGGELVKIPISKEASVGGVRPRNKEQQMALDALTDDNIRAVTLTGPAGTGKTLLALAAAMHKVEQKVYSRIILTRPMSEVGRYKLGALPGDVNEKFGPYLQNYMCNMEFLLKGNKQRKMDDMQSVMDQFNIELIPLQLIRGASWPEAIIIADEVQTLNYHEMLTLGTRVGEGSKIIIMGDLAQRDEKIKKDKTGIFKFINSPLTKTSPLVAHIELWKCERSAISRLFAEVFEEEDD